MSGTLLSAPKEIRARWYLLVGKYGKSVKEVCGTFGISRKTYYKWYRRDHPVGMTGKPPRKMHPHTKLVGQVRVWIFNAKLEYNYGPKKMSLWLQKKHGIKISHQTIYKFYKKKRLIRKPQKKLKWYMPLKEPYFASIPGENVQLDVKFVPGANQTWEYQYRFLDTVTNLQYAVNTLIKDAKSTIFVFKLAAKHFPFSITGIQTDNGGEFRGSFHQYIVNRGIVHRYIPKRSAPWNGKVERANRSVDDEYYLNPTKHWKTIAEYVHWFNHERPHLGKTMHGLTPFEKFLSLTQKCNP